MINYLGNGYNPYMQSPVLQEQHMQSPVLQGYPPLQTQMQLGTQQVPAQTSAPAKVPVSKDPAKQQASTNPLTAAHADVMSKYIKKPPAPPASSSSGGSNA